MTNLGRFVFFFLAGMCLFLVSATAASTGSEKSIIAEMVHLISNIEGGENSNERNRAIKRPLIVPNSFLENQGFLQRLSGFGSIPVTAEDSVAFGDRKISKIIADALPKILIGNYALSADQESELNSAYSKLYSDGDRSQKTQEYDAYLRFQDQYTALLEELKTSLNDSEKLSIQNRIAAVEDKWLVVGYKPEIDRALSTIGSFSSENSKNDYLSWKSLVDGNQPLSEETLDNAIGSQSGWTRVSKSFPVGTIASINVVMQKSNGVDKQFKLSSGKNVSFDYKLVDVSSPLLIHPFVQSKKWKMSDGGMFSDGKPPAAEEELVPAYVSGIYVIKNFELEFDDRIPSIDINHEKVLNLSFSGLPAIQDGEGSVFLLSRSLAILRPVIIGVVIDTLPKTPDPDAGLIWD